MISLRHIFIGQFFQPCKLPIFSYRTFRLCCWPILVHHLFIKDDISTPYNFLILHIPKPIAKLVTAIAYEYALLRLGIQLASRTGLNVNICHATKHS
ncbi:hypothetical protein RchiOBHm_Chr6g0274671 [Rosa chinensis]|uniref:Uncharacterized protein n=1 Tax=Rosa chinensis TaxID=74649 RepID=A0A2P6PRV5_ROSCH|nr:hypothetical protein RchiOBHm_Chr6g0274671 [Rosa chinensis]